jgi:hypothetical protein
MSIISYYVPRSSPDQLKLEEEREQLLAASYAVYDSVSASGDSAGAAHAAVQSIERSTLVDSVLISGEGCWVYWTDRPEPLAVAFNWPDIQLQLGPALVPTEEEVAARSAEMLRGNLAAGKAMSFAHGIWYASTSRPALLRAWKILEDEGRTSEEKMWLLTRLVPCSGWIVANYRTEEWMSALGGESRCL